MGAPTETEFKLEFWACCTVRLGGRRLHCVRGVLRDSTRRMSIIHCHDETSGRTPTSVC